MTHEVPAHRSARDVVRELQDGTPSIHVDNSRVAQGVIGFATIALRQGEVERITARLRQVLARPA